MAQTTVNTVVNQLTKNSVVGENESSISNPVEAASYYYAGKNLQTITWDLSDDFLGTIIVQASLFSEPSENQWFDVYEIPSLNKSGFYNLLGNFVWIRCVVTNWTQGIVRTVTVNY